MANIDEPSRQIGARIRALREECGRRQEDLAHEAQRFGIPWSRAVVAALEGGRRRVALNEFLALPTLLREAYEVDVSAVDLLVPQQPAALQLSPAMAISPRGVRKLLAGESGWSHGVQYQWTTGDAARLDSRIPSLQRLAADLNPSVRAEALSAQWGEAERKAAKVMGVSPNHVGLGSYVAWGRSIAAERDARLAGRINDDTPPRTLQAIRGHVTRLLLVRLRKVLQQYGTYEETDQQ